MKAVVGPWSLAKAKALSVFGPRSSANLQVQFTGRKIWDSLFAFSSRSTRPNLSAFVRAFTNDQRPTTNDGFLANDQRPTTNDRFFQIRHLHRRQRRLEALVAHLQP